MQRAAILTTTLLCAVGLLYGCTNDFEQFEPPRGAGGTGGTGAETSSSVTVASGGSGGVGGGMGGATASSSSVASSSSTGGMMACNKSSDCPDDTACRNWFCQSKTCMFEDDPDGTQTFDGQTSDDCQKVVCDGMGGTKSIPDDNDTPPSDGNPCTDQTCSNGVPMFPPRPAGYPCQNGVCDGFGTCKQNARAPGEPQRSPSQ